MDRPDEDRFPGVHHRRNPLAHLVGQITCGPLGEGDGNDAPAFEPGLHHRGQAFDEGVGLSGSRSRRHDEPASGGGGRKIPVLLVRKVVSLHPTAPSGCATSG